VLEVDIEGFFDNINHSWMLQNIPMDKKILKEFLKAGFVERNRKYETPFGVPQGGSVSPQLANIVLDGLEKSLRSSVIQFYKKRRKTKEQLETS